MGSIYVLEFGSQTTDLIGNRLREMGFPVKYARSDTRVQDLRDAAGIVVSGGPKSVNEPGAYPYDPSIFDSSIPVLGICYGMQLMGRHLGASLHKTTREYGETRLFLGGHAPLTEDMGTAEIVWMNHGDSITPSGDFSVLGYTERGVPAVIKSGNNYGVQFHPEVTHTEKGRVLLRNFAERVCGLKPSPDGRFDAGKFIEEAVRKLREEVGGKIALVYLSGGVDSTVVAYLAMLAGIERKLVYLEMGNGRKDESAYVERTYSPLLGAPVYVHDKADMFVSELFGVRDPEKKRKTFQKLYNSTKAEVEKEFGVSDSVLVEGTIATDKRESGMESGKGGGIDRGTAATIKTHHNVSENADAWKGKTAEVLAELTKDMVRQVARELGLPEEIAGRRPFPGPGLFVRYPTGVYSIPESLEEDVTDIAERNGFEGYALPRKGVGLKGDERAFEHAALLRGPRDWKSVRRTSKRIIENLPVARVIYLPEDIAYPDWVSETPSHYMTEAGLDRLREVTDVVETTMDAHGIRASQMPVITFGGPGRWVNVIRDVQSEDFRTCRPLRKPDEFPWESYDAIERRMRERLGLEAGVTTFDVSDKPGGTTEWE